MQFYNYWICFHFRFFFLSWYSNRNYKFCNGIKNLCNNRRNLKVRVIIKKKRKKHAKIVLLATSHLNRKEVLIYKALIDSNISHDESTLINNVLKQFYDMKEEIKNSNK